MSDNTDRHYMQRALDLAGQALGRTSPNPVVGAVIVKDDAIVGEGYHQCAGLPHAEVNALEAAGAAACGSTIYVTLEPCSHQGRTPPCAQALVQAGITRAVVATVDPNPKVSGQGLKILRQAGIEVHVGVMEEEARRQNEFFLKYISSGVPFVTLKWAMTLDGKIATAQGDSRWVSGEKSRRFVHQLRDIHDGILVGIGTVLADDPLLNTRLEKEDRRNPVRVIVDGGLELPLDSQIIRTCRQQRTLVFCSREAERERAQRLLEAGVEVLEVQGGPEKLSIADILTRLGQMGICSLLVEGGASINAAFIEAGLIDKVHVFIAPKIIGGRQALTPVAGEGRRLMEQAWRLKKMEVSQVGEDILLTAYFPEAWQRMKAEGWKEGGSDIYRYR